MHAYSEAPRAAEGSPLDTAMDATAITSSLSQTLTQTDTFASKSPRTRQALFLQVEQRLVQTMCALTELRLWPHRCLFVIHDDLPAPMKLWLMLDLRRSAIFEALPESIQQVVFDSEEDRGRAYAIQFGPRDALPPRPRPALPEAARAAWPQNGTVAAEKQPVPFKPRPRPRPAETALPPTGGGFSF